MQEAAFKEAIQTRVFVKGGVGRRIVYTNKETGNAIELPWIFDFRAVILDSEWINAYAEIFWERYASLFPFQVGGIESAGIPLVTAIVMKGVERGTPVNGFFIRKSRKREGLMKHIEGTVTKDPVILVDDLVNTGNTLNHLLLVAKKNGARVTDLFTVLRFRPLSTYSFATEAGVRLASLYTLEDFGEAMRPEKDERVPKKEFEIEWAYVPENPSFEYVVQKSSPVLDKEKLYVGTDAGNFVALRQKDGSVAWAFEIGSHPKGKGIFSSPALYSGAVYFGAYDGNVYALDAASGKEKWRNEEADWIGSSPSLAPDLGLLYVGLEFGLWKKRGGIAALDMKTGATRWQHRTAQLTHGSPLYIKEESLVVIGSNDGIAYAYDAKTGEKKWQYQTGGDIKMAPAYDGTRHLVLVPSMDGSLYALSTRTGSCEWVFRTRGSFYSSPLIYADVAYAASNDKSVYAIDLDRGILRSRFETNGRIFSSPVFAEDAIWIGSNDGKLYELDQKTLALKHSFQTEERIVGAMRYNAHTKRFFVSTVANEILCLRRAIQ